MIHVVMWECKKIFKKKSFWILCVLIVLFIGYRGGHNVFWQLQVQNTTSAKTDDQGNHLLTKEAFEEEERINHEYAGVYDDNSIKKIQEEYDALEYQQWLDSIDHEKMKEVYGKDWIDQAWQNDAFEFGHCDESYSDLEECHLVVESGKNMIYASEEKGYSRVRLLILGRILDKYHARKTALEIQPELAVKNNDWGYDDIETFAHLQKQVKTQEFYYDDYHGWYELFWCMKFMVLPLSIFMVYISANMFTKEKNANMEELHRTTHFGKKQLAIAKIISLGLFAIGIPLLFILFLTIMVKVLIGLGNWNVNMFFTDFMFWNYPLQLYTIKQTYLLSILMFCGISFLFTMIGACISKFVKKGYYSFLFTLLLVLFPYFINMQRYDIIMPIHMLDFSKSLYENPLINIANHFIKTPYFLILWMMVAILLASIIILLDRKKIKLFHKE